MPRLNDFDRGGRLLLPGLQKEVKVVRDENGMAYIRAAGEDDLARAQGFVTAQDRLFSMQLTRLFASGRISELVGEKGKRSDTLMRTIGFLRQAKRHEKILDERTRRLFQNYIDGVNAFVAGGKDLPLEFRLAGIKPEPWTVADSLAILYYMGWNSAANLETEVVAQMLVEKVGEARAREIFPVTVNPDDPLPAVRPKAAQAVNRPHFNLAGDGALLALLRETEGTSARREQQLGHVRRPFRERETGPRQRPAPRRPDPPRPLVPDGADHAAGKGGRGDRSRAFPGWSWDGRSGSPSA